MNDNSFSLQKIRDKLNHPNLLKYYGKEIKRINNFCSEFKEYHYFYEFGCFSNDLAKIIAFHRVN